MMSEVYKRKVGRQDELLDCILDYAACIQKREDKLKQKKRELLK
jgi:hypothetical protein